MIPNGHVNFYTDDEWIQMGTVKRSAHFQTNRQWNDATQNDLMGGCKQPAVQDMPQQSHVRSFLVVNL